MSKIKNSSSKYNYDILLNNEFYYIFYKESVFIMGNFDQKFQLWIKILSIKWKSDILIIKYLIY